METVLSDGTFADGSWGVMDLEMWTLMAAAHKENRNPYSAGIACKQLPRYRSSVSSRLVQGLHRAVAIQYSIFARGALVIT